MPLGDNSGDWKQWSQYVLNELKETREEIKNIYEQIKLQGETLLVNTGHLEEHMARTEQVEEMNRVLAEKMNAIEKEKIEKTAVAQYKSDVVILMSKIFGGIGAVAGIVYSIFELIDYLKTHMK
jgi:hypothetical protein